MPGRSKPLFPRIETRASPNKGLGVFTLQDLQHGDLIMTERPICIMTKPTNDGGGWSQMTDEDVRQSLQTATPEEQRGFHALAEGSDPDLPPLARKFATNAFGYLTRETSCICLQLSRFNHSCLPNATWNIDRNSGRFIARAIQPIKEGEEIFFCNIDYSNASATSDVRRHLISNWGFICDCRACTPGQFQRCSDMRRSLIRHLRFLVMFARNDALAGHAYNFVPSIMKDGKIVEIHRTLKRRTVYYFLMAHLLAAEGIVGVELMDAWNKASNTLLKLLSWQKPDSIPSFRVLQVLKIAKDWRTLALQTQKCYRPEELGLVRHLESKLAEVRIRYQEKLIDSCHE